MAATTFVAGSAGFITDVATTLYNTKYASTYGTNPPYSEGGRKRIIWATFSNAAQAAGNYVIARIPKNTRILGIKVNTSVTHGASATLAFGIAATDGSGFIDAANTVSDSTTFFSAAAVLNQVTEKTIMPDATTPFALNYGYLTQKEVYLSLTTAVAALAATGTTTVAIEIVTD